MHAPGLHGPYPLDCESIRSAVDVKSAGAYALGQSSGDSFLVRFVGRSDSDVAKRLKDHIGAYSHFEFAVFDSAKAAFDKECELYHALGETRLDSSMHPLRRARSGWRCPHCRTFDY